MRITVLSAVVALGVAACGGGDAPGDAPPTSESPEPSPTPPSEEFGLPSWMQVDHAARTVVIQLEAGATEDKQSMELQWRSQRGREASPSLRAIR